MADVQARVVTGSDGEVALYLWSDEKTPGGASARYARLSVEEGEVMLSIGTRLPTETATHEELTTGTLGAAMVRAFAHVQPKMADEVRRASFVIVFGEGDRRWSMPDPGHPIVDRAQRETRYGSPTKSDGLVLADTVSALHYLIHTCPSTKLACEKLAAMRAAARKLGPSTEDIDPKPLRPREG